MLTAEPKITWLSGRDFRQRGRLVCLLLILWIAEQHVDLVNVEPR
jgi:hypothetical protein